VNVKTETIKVDNKNIACDGGGGQLGHPRVFLSINDEQKATCPYCGQVYLYEPGQSESGH